MTCYGVANPIELSVLRQILDDHCREVGAEEDSPLREVFAARIMALFLSGTHGLQQIKEALRKDWAM